VKDLKRATQLLNEAGYQAGPDGVRMKVTAICTEHYKPMTEVIVQQLRKIGVQVGVDLVDTATWISRQTQRT
jgi:ABC-type transport system substrate-binding protein